MTETTLSLGQIVESKAGRDRGRSFLIVAFPDENYVSLADGDLRKLAKPKRKKRKHIKAKPVIVKDIQTRLRAEEALLDADLRKAIKAYKEAQEVAKN